MISVIVPVYNVAPYVERCIYSIMHQTYTDIEIIIVDDGSTDKSGQICDRLAQEDERIVVVHKSNGGDASARNAGIDIAKGEFIAFVDSDDYIEETMYETMLCEMSDPEITVVNCGLVVTYPSGETIVSVAGERKIFNREEALTDFFERRGNITPSSSTKLYRREIFDKGIRYNTSIVHDDTELVLHYLKMIVKAVVLDKAFYHYMKRNDSISMSKKFNLRGYRFLDVMAGYRSVICQEYPMVFPVYKFYMLITTYEMLLYLSECIDYNDYKAQEISLRWRVIKGLVLCVFCNEIRKRHANEMKGMLIKTVLGIRITKWLLERKR